MTTERTPVVAYVVAYVTGPRGETRYLPVPAQSPRDAAVKFRRQLPTVRILAVYAPDDSWGEP